jgi:hypothetical protein
MKYLEQCIGKLSEENQLYIKQNFIADQVEYDLAIKALRGTR